MLLSQNSALVFFFEHFSTDSVLAELRHLFPTRHFAFQTLQRFFMMIPALIDLFERRRRRCLRCRRLGSLFGVAYCLLHTFAPLPILSLSRRSPALYDAATYAI